MKKLLVILAMVSFTHPLIAESDTERIARLESIVESLQMKAKRSLFFDVDYRVTHDQLAYEFLDGTKEENKSLLMNRFILGFGYIFDHNLSFSGSLGYNKAFGDSSDHLQRGNTTNPNYGAFDWIVNENANENVVHVKEVSFLWRDKTFWGLDIPWTFSIGRRPSTNGFMTTYREGFESPKSPLGHAINSEYDGLSWLLKLENITGIEGMDFKICAGRGLSNARGRYVPVTSRGGNMELAYTRDLEQSPNIDMAGFIVTYINDGKYHLKSMYYHAKNLIGMSPSVGYSSTFASFGDLSGLTFSFEMRGIGDYINDFLDETVVIASYSASKTHPNPGMAMIGDTASKTGGSLLLGIRIPWFFKDGDQLGFEYNHGTRYWRSFSYAEDTVIGSKMAARGSAYEAYYNLPIRTNAFSFQVRYTYIDYDYTGSNGFFGATTGTPKSMAQAIADGEEHSTVKSAQALRFMIRYKY